MSDRLKIIAAVGCLFGFVLASAEPSYGQGQRLPSTQEFMNVLALCGAGSGIKIEGDLQGSITSLYEREKTQGKAVQDIIAKILN